MTWFNTSKVDSCSLSEKPVFQHVGDICIDSQDSIPEMPNVTQLAEKVGGVATQISRIWFQAVGLYCFYRSAQHAIKFARTCSYFHLFAAVTFLEGGIMSFFIGKEIIQVSTECKTI